MIWPWKHNSNTSNVHEIMLYYTRTPESAFRGFYNLELFIIGLINFQIVFISVSSFIGEGDGTPLQSSCLENPMDGLVGCSPWGRKQSDMTERLHFRFSLSCTGEENGNPLQCSCLENPRDRGAWWAAVYGVAQSRTQLKRLSSSSSSSSSFIH